MRMGRMQVIRRFRQPDGKHGQLLHLAAGSSLCHFDDRPAALSPPPCSAAQVIAAMQPWLPVGRANFRRQVCGGTESRSR